MTQMNPQKNPQHKPSSDEIRQQFLNFFTQKGHQVVGSSSLVPHGDNTLLFSNAGMNQFKDVFLGFDNRPYRRAASSQKCVRAGGKHNDLENVGYTARHHTFFEMLGNFSFGDYFKREAIAYAWELLTQVFGIPAERLLVTVYADDDETYAIWHQLIGLPASKIIRIGDNKGTRYASDNFWMMGDTGPCGPCTEIFYDHGAHIAGGLPGSADEDGDRFIEIWNLVFMQFNRDAQGTMQPLPKPSVDTGMGLERIAAVLQGVHSNYDIDLFQSLIQAAAQVTACKDVHHASLKVLADHIRACGFLLTDGVIPSNEGRGYVLRRIIRRAIRHGYKLGMRKAFFYQLVPALVAVMGQAYADLSASQARVEGVLRQEEERFFETIDNGMVILMDALATPTNMVKTNPSPPRASDIAVSVTDKVHVSGDIAFKLHDTYGFPLDLTQDICREHGVTVDVAGFDAAMAQQKAQARAAGKFQMDAQLDYQSVSTDFRGYDTLQVTATITALYQDGAPVSTLNAGASGVVVLDSTPFYAESGGQVGDSGVLTSADGQFVVDDTQKIQASVFGHHGTLQQGQLKVGDSVTAQVNQACRYAIMRNHSATHLMHKALREVLGEHVQQKGSLVDADKTRFDFAHPAPLSSDAIARVENIVNAEILSNTTTQARIMDMKSAQHAGAVMLFGEKYGDRVRVLDIGSSRELCGGTHVARTGDIGLLRIVTETGVAAGVRRVEAVTGEGALRYTQAQSALLATSAASLNTAPQELPTKLAQMLAQQKNLEKDLARLNAKLASSASNDLLQQAVAVGNIQVLAAQLANSNANTLREMIDRLRDKLGRAVVVLACVNDGKVSLAAGVTADLTAKIKAGELVNFVAQQVGGKGGGRADFAMAGGTDVAGLAAALGSVKKFVCQKI